MIPEVEFRHLRGDELRSRLATIRRHDWLTASELRRSAEFRDRRRQEQWVLGRVLAKELITDALNAHQVGTDRPKPNEIEIDSRNERGQAVRPNILHGKHRIDRCLSISHTDDMITAAISRNPRLAVGVDLVPTLQNRADSLLLWMTTREQQWLAHIGSHRDVLKVWGLKEAIYKATNCGESFAPHRIEIFPDDDNHYRCFINNLPLRGLQLCIEEYDSQLMIAVSAPCVLSRAA